jgi:hypothetical protein
MVKPLKYWTDEELWTELRRLDAMQGARSGMTMMRRNDIWNELKLRLEMAA